LAKLFVGPEDFPEVTHQGLDRESLSVNLETAPIECENNTRREGYEENQKNTTTVF
jgi:hypothetical protein